MARHTFATTITLSQGMPIETVSCLLGHTNIKTTQIYAKITNEKISRDMSALTERLGDKYRLAGNSPSALVRPSGFTEDPPGAQGHGLRAVGSLSSASPADGHDGGTVAHPSAASRPRLFYKKA